MLVTEDSQEVTLKFISCIQYLVEFQKDKDNIQALLNLGSKVNVINPAYTKKIGLHVRQTDMGAQKIDGSYLNTFKMVIASLSLQNMLKKI